MSLQGFDHHVKHDHNMWTYIYFSIYLDTIDISDHNAIEKYVYEMVRPMLLLCYICNSVEISLYRLVRAK